MDPHHGSCHNYRTPITLGRTWEDTLFFNAMRRPYPVATQPSILPEGSVLWIDQHGSLVIKPHPLQHPIVHILPILMTGFSPLWKNSRSKNENNTTHSTRSRHISIWFLEQREDLWIGIILTREHMRVENVVVIEWKMHCKEPSLTTVSLKCPPRLQEQREQSQTGTEQWREGRCSWW